MAKAKTIKLDSTKVENAIEQPEILTKDAMNAVEDINEVGKKMTASVESWKTYASTLATKDECTACEDKLIVVMDENEAYIKNRTYTLPAEGDFAGEKVTARRCADAIVTLLEKNEVSYSMTLGLYELSKFWRGVKAGEQIAYHVFDSTLRALEQLKFKGYAEWKAILMVNNFFKPLHDDYARDITYSIYLAQVHNAIIERMTALDQPEETATEQSDASK